MDVEVTCVSLLADPIPTDQGLDTGGHRLSQSVVQKVRIKLSAGLVPLDDCEEGSALSLSSAYAWPSSLLTFTLFLSLS